MVPACHPILLTYVQPELEAAFADFHNHAVSSLEKMGCRLGVLVIAIYYMANIVRGQPIPFHTTILTYLIFTTSIEALRWSRPTFFFRYREHMQLVKRLVCFSLACLVQEDESANSAGGAIFNYGMTSAIFSAFENKVRFHLQLCYSLLTHVIGCFAMIAEDNATPFKMLLHAVVVAYVPGALVFLWDRRARASFLQTAEAHRLLTGRQRAVPRAGYPTITSVPSTSRGGL